MHACSRPSSTAFSSQKKKCPTLSPALVDRAVRAVNVDFSCFGAAHAVSLDSFPSEGALRVLELSRVKFMKNFIEWTSNYHGILTKESSERCDIPFQSFCNVTHAMYGLSLHS